MTTAAFWPSRETTPDSTLADAEWNIFPSPSPDSVYDAGVVSAFPEPFEVGDNVRLYVDAPSETLTALGASFIMRPAMISALSRLSGHNRVHAAYTNGAGFFECHLDDAGHISAVYPSDQFNEAVWSYIKQDSGAWIATRVRFLNETPTNHQRVVSRVSLIKM